MRSRWLSWAVIGLLVVGGLIMLGMMQRQLTRVAKEREAARAQPAKPWTPRASGPTGPSGATGAKKRPDSIPAGAIW